MTMSHRAVRTPVRSDGPETGKWWIYGAVGLVFLLMGLFVLAASWCSVFFWAST